MTPEVRLFDGPAAATHVDALGSVLLDCVAGGASVGFMASFDQEGGRRYFESVVDEVDQGRRLLLAAFDDGELVGTVQVLLATMPNQPHRGEIMKLLVRRSVRGRGVGAALMERAEDEARAAGKTLLVLDTANDAAERLYERAGWTRVGTVPNYALMPDGAPCATTFFWKAL
jgi:ribosomal protein S18 acetylase RimI-like enzyme